MGTSASTAATTAPNPSGVGDTEASSGVILTQTVVDSTTVAISCSTSQKDPDLADLQRVDSFLQQLPYFEQTKRYAFRSFDELKRNLAEAVLRNEIRPGFTHWTNQLIVFVHEYGLFFTKADHLQLIKLFLGVAQTPDIDLPTIDFCFAALYELLKYFFVFFLNIYRFFF